MATTKNDKASRVVIGVDPHKRIDAVVVLDQAGAVLARETRRRCSTSRPQVLTGARVRDQLRAQDR